MTGISQKGAFGNRDQKERNKLERTRLNEKVN